MSANELSVVFKLNPHIAEIYPLSEYLGKRVREYMGDTQKDFLNFLNKTAEETRDMVDITQVQEGIGNDAFGHYLELRRLLGDVFLQTQHLMARDPHFFGFCMKIGCAFALLDNMFIDDTEEPEVLPYRSRNNSGKNERRSRRTRRHHRH